MNTVLSTLMIMKKTNRGKTGDGEKEMMPISRTLLLGPKLLSFSHMIFQPIMYNSIAFIYINHRRGVSRLIAPSPQIRAMYKLHGGMPC